MRSFEDCSARSLGVLVPSRVLLLSSVWLGLWGCVTAQDPGFPAGIKFGDVTSTKVTIWTRVGTVPPQGLAEPDGPESAPVAASVRFEIRPEGGRDKRQSKWLNADEFRDAAVQTTMDRLEPDTKYNVTAIAMLDENNQRLVTTGTFRTAPPASSETAIRFAVITCQKYLGFDDGDRGYRTYRTLAAKMPHFVVHTGDYVYYDQEPVLAKNVSQARHHWHRMDGLPNIRNLHRQTVWYAIKDDHDLLKDDCQPGQKYGDLTFQRGVLIHREQNPIEKEPYRTIRWGKHLQVWLMEGREFRSPNRDPDGPEKSIWGVQQKEWFVKSVEESNATFKLLIQATPLIGPDRQNKADNHANAAFQTEGDWLRSFAAEHGMISVNGDRHWQYVSVDPETQLMEFGTGPVHDARAQGWKKDDRRENHRFLRVAGGFLWGRLETEGGIPQLTLTHLDVNGRERHQEVLTAP